MQHLKIPCAVGVVFLSSACSQPIENSTTKLMLHSTNECELIFKSQNTRVIENFCTTKGKPILIQFNDRKIGVDWIDEKTSRFLFQEGCAAAGRCIYELSATENGLKGRFSYHINLTEGEYSFEIKPNGVSKLISESSRDIAS